MVVLATMTENLDKDKGKSYYGPWLEHLHVFCFIYFLF